MTIVAQRGYLFRLARDALANFAARTPLPALTNTSDASAAVAVGRFSLPRLLRACDHCGADFHTGLGSTIPRRALIDEQGEAPVPQGSEGRPLLRSSTAEAIRSPSGDSTVLSSKRPPSTASEPRLSTAPAASASLLERTTSLAMKRVPNSSSAPLLTTMPPFSATPRIRLYPSKLSRICI